jgi:hypothetical protein
MGYLNINNCNAIGDRPFSSKQNIEIAKHIDLRLEGNHYQVNSDLMKGSSDFSSKILGDLRVKLKKL